MTRNRDFQASCLSTRGINLTSLLLTSLRAAGRPPSCIRRPTQFRGAKPDQSAEASCGSYTTSPVRPASGAALQAVGAGAAVTLTFENGSLSRYPSNLLRNACCCSQDCFVVLRDFNSAIGYMSDWMGFVAPVGGVFFWKRAIALLLCSSGKDRGGIRQPSV